MDILLNKFGVETEEFKNEYYDESEQEEYIWEELFEELRFIDDEISRNLALAKQFLDGVYIGYNDIRILYYIS